MKRVLSIIQERLSFAVVGSGLWWIVEKLVDKVVDAVLRLATHAL